MEAMTVSQLNGYIKNIFDAEELLHNIPVVGEVFGVSTSRQITYFSLKDENATISCVCFYPAIASLIQEGKRVIITGSPNYYVKGGKLSFNVTRVEELGQGKLYEEFLKLKAKLEMEGLFDSLHKKTIPKSIKRIGVITSKDGAVIQDIKNVTWRRNPNVDIVLYPVKVQGINAEYDIANAIDKMSNYENVDVIIVARGGGSLEDLSAYNTEVVARATYNCDKPIVSAVGHEVDFTIIDFVSDLRAPTPSAAAEILTFNLYDKRQEITALTQRFISGTTNYLQDNFDLIYSMLSVSINALEKKYAYAFGRFNYLKTKLTSSMERFINDTSYTLGLQDNTLQKLNPHNVLKQGYVKIEQNGKSINDKKSVKQNDKIEIIFVDGRMQAMPIKEEK